MCRRLDLSDGRIADQRFANADRVVVVVVVVVVVDDDDVVVDDDDS